MATKAKTTLKPRGKAFPKGNNMNPAGAPVTEARLSFHIRNALQSATTSKQYADALNEAEAIGRDYVKQYWKARTVADKGQVMDRLANRTEGMPKQSTDITSGGDRIQPVLVRFIGQEELSPNDPHDNHI